MVRMLVDHYIIQIRGSIVVSIFARHAEDPGSIPGRGVYSLTLWPGMRLGHPGPGGCGCMRAKQVEGPHVCAGQRCSPPERR